MGPTGSYSERYRNDGVGRGPKISRELSFFFLQNTSKVLEIQTRLFQLVFNLVGVECGLCTGACRGY